MKKICLLLILLLPFFNKSKAQNTDYPWAVHFGYAGVDFSPAISGSKPFSTKNWNQGVQLSILRSLNSSFNVALSGTSGVLELPKTAFNTDRFSSLDVTLQYKFANGYILKEDSWFDPYLFGGGGLTFIAKNKRWMGNLGLGINFWFQENLGLTVQTSFNPIPDYENYLQHTLGLKYRWGIKDADKDGVADKEDACPDTPGLKTLKGCPDTDLDGIADKEDACPTVAGLTTLAGCPDGDGDGVADKDDTCPTEKGLAALGGCPDGDGDGVADKNDSCPTEKGLANLGGCPDGDGDGIADKNDSCPLEKGSSALSGCPDSDGDGIADKDDKCPNQAGISSQQGCPEKKIAKEEVAKIEKQLKAFAKKVQFETGKDVITKTSLAELDKIIGVMNEYPGSKFNVEGHTDNVGNANNNKVLSQKRADAVKKYFTDKSISSERIVSVGYGSTKPADTNATPAGRANNRRVEIKVAE